ncbi:hypothetical protein CVT24_000644 [Panaeolus cyanescens]|uniref:Uncharacterized protein n=1 Tax=Panaeolus cyanescens TaxID=181874 RepID=A0A409YTA2_9AGAR|nr:hypothetical protein CVT24_000644 [Panaeolus cyanescens]
MGTNVDDRHDSIAYRGRWSSSGGDSQYYGSTISATNNNGATATFRFRGTKVKLFLVVPIGNSGSVKIRATLDNRAPFDQERHAHPYTVYNDVWFEANHLDNTEHTLVITNTGTEGGNAMQIDRFEIDGSPISPAPPPPPPPPPTTPTPTPTPQRTATQTTTHISSHVVTSVVIQTNTVVTTNSVVPTPGISSSDPVSSPSTSGSSLSGSSTVSSTNSASGASSSPSQPSAGDKTVTAIQIITTAPNGSVQTITTTPDQQGSLGDTSDEVPLGAIIGGVVGALVLLVIAGILAFLLIRRRKKRIALGDDSERLTRRRGAISPFSVEDQGDSPPNSATVLRQPSSGTTATSNSRSRSGYHGFNSDEKRGDPFANTSAETSDENHSSSGTPTTEVGGATALPPIETGGNNLNIRPHYLSGETIPADSPSIYSQSGPLSALARPHLNLQDSHDVPPSYQSVGNRASDVRQSLLNSAYLSYMSPRYSDHGPNFGFGNPTATEPQAR